MPPAAKRRIWSLRRRCRCAPSATGTAHCSAENTAGLRPACFSVCAVLCCPRSTGRSTLLFYPISGQKERGVIPLVLFGLFTCLGGSLHLAELMAFVAHAALAHPVGQTERTALGAGGNAGSLQLPHGATALVPALLDTLLLGTAIYDTSLGSCPGRAKLTQTLYPTAAQGQQNVDQFQACSRRVPR